MGGDVEYYEKFSFSETEVVSADIKLKYIELYDNLLSQLGERKIENKDMIRQEIKN